MILRRALRASALTGGASATLLALLVLGPALPEAAAWFLAYSAVTSGMLALVILGWVVASLPPGAPIRTRGLRAMGAVAILGIIVLALRTGIAG